MKIEYKALLNILYPIRMPPTTMSEDSLNDRHQSCASRIQVVIQWQFALLKIISFRQFKIAQTRAQTPILIHALDVLSIPFGHFLNMFLILK
jgi:hypothetical protein